MIIDSPAAMIEFTRVYLAVFYTLVAGFYTVRIVLKKRTDSREVVFAGERFSATWWNHMLFRIFRVLIWMVCLLRWLFPQLDTYLGLLNNWQNVPVILLGNLLLTGGFLFTILIHFSFGKQWTSGINPSGPAALITDGFYQYSRNPMFVSVAIAQVGFFLALPSIFSFICLIVGLCTLRCQALEEEAHLMKYYPQVYPEYMRRVRRWI